MKGRLSRRCAQSVVDPDQVSRRAAGEMTTRPETASDKGGQCLEMVPICVQLRPLLCGYSTGIRRVSINRYPSGLVCGERKTVPWVRYVSIIFGNEVLK